MFSSTSSFSFIAALLTEEVNMAVPDKDVVDLQFATVEEGDY